MHFARPHLAGLRFLGLQREQSVDCREGLGGQCRMKALYLESDDSSKSAARNRSVIHQKQGSRPLRGVGNVSDLVDAARNPGYTQSWAWEG